MTERAFFLIGQVPLQRYPRTKRAMRAMANSTTNTKNRTCAIPADALAIPPNPKIAATIATTKKISAQYNMLVSFTLFITF